MHDLFDLGLVAVDPDRMRLLVAAELASTKYGQYEDRALFVPSEPELRPNGEALEKHRAQSAVA
jgi:putative restriction endonuclease